MNGGLKMASISGAVVTGGAGFIGSHLCEALLNRGMPVISVDNYSTGLRENTSHLEQLSKPQNFLTVEADAAQPWSWQKKIPNGWLKKISHVFHFASPASPPLYQEMAFSTLWVNALGLKNAIEFADSLAPAADEHGARVIFASTSEIYGDPSVSPQPETYWGNVNSFGIRSCYDESKRFGEALIFTHNWKKNTQHGLVRIFNTYGPRMNPHDGRVVINFLVQACENQPLTIYGDGQQTRSFCYIDDLVDGILRYAESSLTEPLNLGNDTEFTVLQLAEAVESLVHEKNLPLVFRSLPKDDPKQRRPDLSRAREKLAPWEPRISLSDGLQRTYEWLKSQRRNNLRHLI